MLLWVCGAQLSYSMRASTPARANLPLHVPLRTLYFGPKSTPAAPLIHTQPYISTYYPSTPTPTCLPLHTYLCIPTPTYSPLHTFPTPPYLPVQTCLYTPTPAYRALPTPTYYPTYLLRTTSVHQSLHTHIHTHLFSHASLCHTPANLPLTPLPLLTYPCIPPPARLILQICSCIPAPCTSTPASLPLHS